MRIFLTLQMYAPRQIQPFLVNHMGCSTFIIHASYLKYCRITSCLSRFKWVSKWSRWITGRIITTMRHSSSTCMFVNRHDAYSYRLFFSLNVPILSNTWVVSSNDSYRTNTTGRNRQQALAFFFPCLALPWAITACSTGRKKTRETEKERKRRRTTTAMLLLMMMMLMMTTEKENFVFLRYWYGRLSEQDELLRACTAPARTALVVFR